ncbi:MAG: transposase family protein [Gammaproteobacteria bacterium]|nr:transposase family protein [Gammaproteobacteria bacterium]
MKSLSDFFKEITDSRRTQGRRHQLSTVLSIAVAATLCGRLGKLSRPKRPCPISLST